MSRTLPILWEHPANDFEVAPRGEPRFDACSPRHRSISAGFCPRDRILSNSGRREARAGSPAEMALNPSVGPSSRGYPADKGGTIALGELWVVRRNPQAVPPAASLPSSLLPASNHRPTSTVAQLLPASSAEHLPDSSRAASAHLARKTWPDRRFSGPSYVRTPGYSGLGPPTCLRKRSKGRADQADRDAGARAQRWR